MKKLSAIIISIVLLLTLCACKKNGGDSASSVVSDSEAFVKPTDYAVVLSMKINPGFNIYIDSKNYVVGLEALNEDAKVVKQNTKSSTADIKSVMKSILTAAKDKGFLKDNAEINLKITELNNTQLNPSEILNDAASAVKNAANELKTTVTVNTADTTANGNEAQSNSPTESNTEQTASNNASSATQSTSSVHKHTYSKATCTEPAKCSCGATTGSALGHSWKAATCQAPKTCKTCNITEGAKANHTFENGKCTVCGLLNILNPKTNIKLEEEYVAKVYNTYDENSIYAPGIAFYNDGGYGEGVYCLLLEANFSTEIVEGRNPVTYNGKKYYRQGGGMNPAYVEMTDTEIVITNDTNKIKMVLMGDGNLKVTSSNNKSYSTDTVLSISWNYLK